MVFYEAPHKLLSTLKDMLSVFGNRKISICRELTKIHEQVKITTLEDAVEFYSQNPPKGEFVLIVSGCRPESLREEYTLEDAVKMAKDYMSDGLSASSAAKNAAAETGIRKSEIYSHLN